MSSKIPTKLSFKRFKDCIVQQSVYLFVEKNLENIRRRNVLERGISGSSINNFKDMYKVNKRREGGITLTGFCRLV